MDGARTGKTHRSEIDLSRRPVDRSVALNYYTPHEHGGSSPARGKISRYAWGDDYHDVLKEKLRLLFDWIKTEKPEAEAKICVGHRAVYGQSVGSPRRTRLDRKTF